MLIFILIVQPLKQEKKSFKSAPFYSLYGYFLLILVQTTTINGGALYFLHALVIIAVKDLFYGIKPSKNSRKYSRYLKICKRNPDINNLKQFRMKKW